MAEQVPAVCEVLDAIERRDWAPGFLSFFSSVLFPSHPGWFLISCT
jgi:hypothetical protein